MTPNTPAPSSPWKATQQGRVRTAVDAYNASHEFLARLDEEDRATSQERCKAAVDRVLQSACRATWNNPEEVAPEHEWIENEDGIPIPHWRRIVGTRENRWGCGCPTYIQADHAHQVICHGCDNRVSGCDCAPADRTWTTDADSTCETDNTDPPKTEPFTSTIPPYQGGPTNGATHNFSEDPDSEEWWWDRTWGRPPHNRPHTAPYTCGAAGCACEDVIVLTRPEYLVLRGEGMKAGEVRASRRHAELLAKRKEGREAMTEGVTGMTEAIRDFSATLNDFAEAMAGYSIATSPTTPRPPNRAERRNSPPRLRDVQRARIYESRPEW